MDLQQWILIDLQAWCGRDEDLAGLSRRMVDQLESGQRRASCPAAGGGYVRWVFDEQQRALLVSYPSGASRVRDVC